MNGGRAKGLQGDLVARARVPLVGIEVEPWVVLGLVDHQPVPGDLGQDRRSGDRYRHGVAFDQLDGALVAHEVPFAVQKHGVGRPIEAERIQRSSGGQALRSGHAEPIALGVGGMADRPGLGPACDPIEEGLPLGRQQLLGVPKFVDPAVSGNDDGADGQGSRPGPAADLVEADHDLATVGPQFSFGGQARRRGLECTAEFRHGPHAGNPSESSDDRGTFTVVSAEVIEPPLAPRSILRPADQGRTALGVFGGPVTGWVDQGGAIQLSDRSWCLDWWIRADDRWHFPAREPAVRQRRLGAGPVVQTAVRVPGGDVFHRAWMSHRAGRPVMVLEVENPTSVPVGLALAARQYDLGGRPARVDTEFGSDRFSIDDHEAITTLRCSARIRDTVPEEGAAILPLPHRSTIRAAVATHGGSLGALGDSASAVRGWDTLVTSAGRVVLPDDRLTAAFDQSRGRLSLGAYDLAERLAALAPAAGNELAAVALGGFGQQARLALTQLIETARLPDGRDGEPSAVAAVLDGLAWAAVLHAPALGEELLASATSLARWVARTVPGGKERSRAEAGLARLAAAAGQLDAAGTIDPSRGIGAPGRYGHDHLAGLLEQASETGAWGADDDSDVAADVVQSIRHLAASEVLGGPDGTEPEVRVFPTWPAAWRGGQAELHDVATVFGSLSVAIRWHGYRPALLWQFDTGAGGPVRLRCPALDPSWSSSEPSGETLLAGTAEVLDDPPDEGMSFS